jgi:hypothetical protein
MQFQTPQPVKYSINPGNSDLGNTPSRCARRYQSQMFCVFSVASTDFAHRIYVHFQNMPFAEISERDEDCGMQISAVPSGLIVVWPVSRH